MEEYTFERLWKELDSSYQIYYTYMDKRYMLSKVTSNCYSNKLEEVNEKTSQPKIIMMTLKSVKEIFPFMQDIEYKI